MAEHRTPYATIAKLTSGERWALALLGVEITVSCKRVNNSGKILLELDESMNDGNKMKKIESFSVKFSHVGTDSDNIQYDRVLCGLYGSYMCDSWDNYNYSKREKDVVDKVEIYQQYSNMYNDKIYIQMLSSKRNADNEDTLSETFYRKMTILSFTTTDGKVHSIDNLNY